MRRLARWWRDSTIVDSNLRLVVVFSITFAAYALVGVGATAFGVADSPVGILTACIAVAVGGMYHGWEMSR